MSFDLEPKVFHLAEGGRGGPAGERGRGQPFTPFANTVILHVLSSNQTVGQYAAFFCSFLQVCHKYISITHTKKDGHKLRCHLKEPLILCNDHLNHSSQSSSDSNVHWIVNCFWLPKLCSRDFDREAKSMHLQLSQQ